MNKTAIIVICIVAVLLGLPLLASLAKKGGISQSTETRGNATTTQPVAQDPGPTKYPSLADAIIAGDEEDAKRHLAKGADVNAIATVQGPSRRVSLSILSITVNAVMEGKAKTSLIETILDAGANVDAQDPENGGTSLHWAALFGFPNIAEVLIRRGANVNARDNVGQTPLVCARRKVRKGDQEAVAQLLLSHGAIE